jgi:hypothetical protein
MLLIIFSLDVFFGSIETGVSHNITIQIFAFWTESGSFFKFSKFKFFNSNQLWKLIIFVKIGLENITKKSQQQKCEFTQEESSKIEILIGDSFLFRMWILYLFMLGTKNPHGL